MTLRIELGKRTELILLRIEKLILEIKVILYDIKELLREFLEEYKREHRKW